MHQSNNIKVESTEEADSLLVFKINNTHFCTRVESVLSITEPEVIYTIPLIPKSIAGLTIFHGDPVPVYCLGTCLGESLDARNRNGVIIFVKTNRQTIGVWVDDTSDIIEVNANDYLEPDEIIKTELIKYCIAYNEKLLLYIDFESLGHSHGRQNSGIPLLYPSSVQQPVADLKSEHGKSTDKQCADNSDDLIENADLTVNTTTLPDQDLQGSPARKITPATNDEVNTSVALDMPENRNVELNKGGDNNKYDTQPVIDSNEKIIKPELKIKTGEKPIERTRNMDNCDATDRAINTNTTDNRLSRYQSHLFSGLHPETHGRPQSFERSTNSSAEHIFSGENNVEEYSGQFTAQRLIQCVQSSENQESKSATNYILWLTVSLLVLFVILFFISTEKNIPDNQRENDAVISKKNSAKGQEKSAASEIYDAKLNTNDISEVHSVPETVTQTHNEHVDLADKQSTHKSAHGKTDAASIESSKLKSSSKPVFSRSDKKSPESTKKSVITKIKASPIKQAEPLPEKQGRNRQAEQEKTVIVELSSETLQIVVERFNDQRKQLANRHKSRKTPIDNFPGDFSVEAAKLKRQSINSAATKPDYKKEIEANLKKPDGTPEDLSHNPEAPKTVTMRESRTVRPSNSKFEEFRYVVTRGDTLWDIAEKFLGDPFKYKLLSEYSHVRDPDWIFPGDVVIIRKKIQ